MSMIIKVALLHVNSVITAALIEQNKYEHWNIVTAKQTQFSFKRSEVGVGAYRKWKNLRILMLVIIAGIDPRTHCFIVFYYRN